MSDFRTKVLQETIEFGISDIVPLYDSSTRTSYVNYLSNILDDEILRSGLIKTGYIPYKTNPKCYPLELDEQGRAFAEIRRTDTVVSAIQYDENSKYIILQLNDPKISDISVPVGDMVNKYYTDDITISSNGNIFGVCDKILHKDGNYISAFSETSCYTMARILDKQTKERNPLSFSNCVRTSVDYEISKSDEGNTILDFRNPNNPVIEYTNGEEIRRVDLTSYEQLHSKEYGTDIRVGEFIYNELTRKLWYMKSTNISDLIQLDEDLVKITVTDNIGGIATYGDGIYQYGDTIEICADMSSGDYRFKQWDDGQEDRIRTINVADNKKYTALFEDGTIVDYYDSYQEEENHYGKTLRKFKQGRYKYISVGAGGLGGRTNAAYFRQGAFGGGSAAKIAGIFDIGQTTNFNITTGSSTTHSTATSIDGNISILADRGENGSWGWFVAYGGVGGKISESTFTGTTKIETECKDGNDGKKDNNGNEADGGYYADSNYPYGGGTTNGIGYSGNIGKSYTSYGYMHIERYMEARFLDYDGSIIENTQYIIRNKTVDVIPENPSRPGYTFTEWSKDPSEYKISNDYDFIAQYTPNLIKITLSVNDSTMGYAHVDEKTEGDYPCDSQVYLNAVSNYGYKFLYWDDDHSITQQKRLITVPTNDTTYTAVFSKDIIVTYYDNI